MPGKVKLGFILGCARINFPLLLSGTWVARAPPAAAAAWWSFQSVSSTCAGLLLLLEYQGLN